MSRLPLKSDTPKTIVANLLMDYDAARVISSLPPEIRDKYCVFHDPFINLAGDSHLGQTVYPFASVIARVSDEVAENHGQPSNDVILSCIVYVHPMCEQCAGRVTSIEKLCLALNVKDKFMFMSLHLGATPDDIIWDTLHCEWFYSKPAIRFNYDN